MQMIAVVVAVERIENGEGDAGQIFRGWHGIEDNSLVRRQAGKKARHGMVAAPDQKGMVPGIDHVLLGDGLDFGEIHHHAVVRPSGAIDDSATEGYFKGVAVAVQVTALALMIRDPVARIEFEAAGYAHGRESRVCGKVVA